MTLGDHQKTASWGNSVRAQNYRNEQLALINQGKYNEAVEKDIKDIRSNFGKKYDGAISMMWSYAVVDLNWK